MIALLKEAARLGWEITISGNAVSARRVALDGRSRETEMDRGITIANRDLNAALLFVLQKLVTESRPIVRQYRSPAAVARRLAGAEIPSAFADATVASAARDIQSAKRVPSAAARLARSEKQIRGLSRKGLLK